MEENVKMICGHCLMEIEEGESVDIRETSQYHTECVEILYIGLA